VPTSTHNQSSLNARTGTMRRSFIAPNFKPKFHGNKSAQAEYGGRVNPVLYSLTKALTAVLEICTR